MYCEYNTNDVGMYAKVHEYNGMYWASAHDALGIPRKNVGMNIYIYIYIYIHKSIQM